MDFKSITKVSLISAAISGTIGILMAVYGFGVWAIVIQSLVQRFVSVFLLWYLVKWIPLWSFSLKSFKELYGFGSKMMLSGLLHTIYLNLYTLLIGKFFNAQTVGFFNRANSLAQYPSTNLVNIINRVYYPVLCKMQNDSQKFANVFHSYLRMACYIIFPLSVLLTALADPLIRVLLTEKWAGAVVPLQIIALAYMLYPIMLINNQPLQALNHTTMFLISEIIKKITAVVLLIISLNYSLYVLCFSIFVYNICDTIIIIYFTRKIMSTGFRKQIRELFPMFLSSVMTGGIVYSFVYFVDINIIWLIIGGGFLGILSYALLSRIFKIREYQIIINLIRNYV
jgi:O-antigen/teichoic acid export membrane protein